MFFFSISLSFKIKFCLPHVLPFFSITVLILLLCMFPLESMKKVTPKAERFASNQNYFHLWFHEGCGVTQHPCCNIGDASKEDISFFFVHVCVRKCELQINQLLMFSIFLEPCLILREGVQ